MALFLIFFYILFKVSSLVKNFYDVNSSAEIIQKTPNNKISEFQQLQGIFSDYNDSQDYFKEKNFYENKSKNTLDISDFQNRSNKNLSQSLQQMIILPKKKPQQTTAVSLSQNDIQQMDQFSNNQKNLDYEQNTNAQNYEQPKTQSIEQQKVSQQLQQTLKVNLKNNQEKIGDQNEDQQNVNDNLLEKICSINFSIPLKINNKTIYSKPPLIPNLKLNLTLKDNFLNFDLSGNQNHGSFVKKKEDNNVMPNLFNSNSFVVVKNQSFLDKLPLTFQFQIKILSLKEDSDFYCPLFLKGNDDFQNEFYERFPALYINEKTGQLNVSISTAQNELQNITSLSYLKENYSYKISLVVQNSKISLFINGKLDSFKILQMTNLQPNNHDLFIGGHPSYILSCKTQFIMQNFKIYAKELQLHDQNAFNTQKIFFLMEPDYIQLGCVDCDYLKGIESCETGYHLCLNIEYVTGARFQAESMGWDKLSESKQFIYQSRKILNQRIKGTALCCKNF